MDVIEEELHILTITSSFIEHIINYIQEEKKNKTLYYLMFYFQTLNIFTVGQRKHIKTSIVKIKNYILKKMYVSEDIFFILLLSFH